MKPHSPHTMVLVSPIQQAGVRDSIRVRSPETQRFREEDALAVLLFS
jgi:hypothetical protein